MRIFDRFKKKEKGNDPNAYLNLQYFNDSEAWAKMSKEDFDAEIKRQDEENRGDT